jgi:hypothetical protein
MLTLILTFHQVMPSYLDFVSVFGVQLEARGLRFSGFREQTTLTEPSTREIPDLGRSGLGYQMCYNLKAVVDKSAVDTPLQNKDWTIRQAAIHHQFDTQTGRTLWITTNGRLADLLEPVKDLTSDEDRKEDWSYNTVEECFKSSLSIHIMYCHWSTSEWRAYVGWLEEIIEKEVSKPIHYSREMLTGTEQQSHLGRKIYR